MGGVSSKIEEDKALQLCRERKKFVRQALDGRCYLAATHIAYIEALKITGTDLRKFVEPEAPFESSIYTSTNVIPRPLALPEKSFSFSSPSISQGVDGTENIYPSPSPPTSVRYHANHMKFRGTFSRKVEEIPIVPVTLSVTSDTPQNSTPHFTERPETSPSETPPVPSEAPEWDFFGLDHGHVSDNHFSPKEARRENRKETGHDREEDGASLLEDEQNFASPRRDESHESDDEFDEPPTETLVRSFENVNRTMDNATSEVSPITTSAASVASEAHSLNGESNLPNPSPLRRPSAGVVVNDAMTPGRENNNENKVAPKDFFSSMKDIELLFIKASDSGREVPRMLEANKFHFRPIFPGRESGSILKTLSRSCFSCGEDPSQVPEEPPQTSVKYLTWHRTTSSRSSSSRNPLGVNSAADDIEDVSNNLFDNFCMNSGSHASTLDRLFAWEKKLYDEVKACDMVRSIYDSRRKVLRQLESKGESSRKIDKVRAVVKDLHSRIGVAIHRINSISRKIEELRDKELQPQLEELIEGLRRMWETMLDCHKHQLHIVSIAHSPGNIKISINSDSHRQIIIHLENELVALSSSFMKWIGAQKAYVEAINTWLLKCVSFEDKSSKKKSRQLLPPRKAAPPIYVICGVWLDTFNSLPTKDVVDTMKSLAAEVTRLLPRHEKNQPKGVSENGDLGITPSRDDASGDYIADYDRFQTSLAAFLGQLSKFAESSVKMFTHLQKATQDAKSIYERVKAMSHDNSMASREKDREP